MSASSPPFRYGSPAADPPRTRSPSNEGNLVEQMKQYVAQVITLCNTMLIFLEQQETDASKQSDENLKPTSGSTSAADRDGSIAFMKQKLRELVDMNVSWQQSHQTQEKRIAELEEQLRETTHRIRTYANGVGGLSEQQQAEIDRQFLDVKRKLQQTEDEKIRVEEENLQLRRDVSALNERVELLNMQLAINREDFESERRDRERAQGRIAELEQEVGKYGSKPPPYPAAGAPAPIYYPNGQLVTGRAAVGGQVWNPRSRLMVDFTDGIDTTDCVEADSPVVSRGTLTIDGATRSQETLQCPNCHRRFTTDQHEQLMNHMDHCN